MNLRDLQLRIFASVADPTPPNEALVRTARELVGDGRRTREAQLATYREQYWLRHHGSLVEDFPTVRALLGESRFSEVARAFLVAHPPISPLLGEASRPFPSYLKDTENELLADAARLDFAIIEAGLAADAAPVSVERITQIAEADWPLATLRLHPALRLLSLSHKLDTYRASVMAGSPGELENASAFIVVERRSNGDVYLEPAGEGEIRLLELLHRGTALGEATAQIDDPDPPLAAWFQRWMSRGWIVGIELPTDREGRT